MALFPSAVPPNLTGQEESFLCSVHFSPITPVYGTLRVRLQGRFYPPSRGSFQRITLPSLGVGWIYYSFSSPFLYIAFLYTAFCILLFCILLFCILLFCILSLILRYAARFVNLESAKKLLDLQCFFDASLHLQPSCRECKNRIQLSVCQLQKGFS